MQGPKAFLPDDVWGSPNMEAAKLLNVEMGLRLLHSVEDTACP